MVSKLSIKKDIWGKYGYPSHDDHSVSKETTLAVIEKMGYVDNEFFDFHDWLTAKVQGGLDVAPCTVGLTYKPTAIKAYPLRVKLYTTWGNGCAGCTIPGISTISEDIWLPYPEEKTPQTWERFHGKITQILASIDTQLAVTEWFFQERETELFTRSEGRTGWEFNGTPVDFEHISFGPWGSYWGTLWYPV